MLKNAYALAKIGADTAENEQHFAEMPAFRDAEPVMRARARCRFRRRRAHRAGRDTPKMALTSDLSAQNDELMSFR